jgi:Fe-S cluster assembly protein SufD
MPATIVPIHENQEAYLAAFARREMDGWHELRRASIERFAALGFPTTKDEDWKYTNLAPFLKKPYQPAAPVDAAIVREQLTSAPFADLGCPRLVFVNGRYAPELSTTPAGVTAGSLGEAPFEDDNALAALNTALFENGAFVRIEDGRVIEQPIHVLYVSSGGGVSYPRSLIVAGRDSQANIVEGYLGFGNDAYFTNAVTDLVAGDGAVIVHTKLQTESTEALHYGLLRVRQGASSNITSHNIALGAALARNEINTVLDGEGAECILNGLYLTTGRQHVDNHTTLDHARPHTTSHELYKGILDGKSEGVFHGRIIVRPEAQKTDAIQRNKNLLLSRDAVINTKPQLEIYADDVRCTHGATVGQVDQDAVFYLRSRGIGLEEARSLLTYAFTSDLIEGIQIPAIRNRLAAALFERLAAGGVR